MITVMTRMPGSSCCRYSLGEPASAPPNRYVNSSTNMIGKAVTSNSCIGTCLILSMARQAKITEARSALGCGGRGRVETAERSVWWLRTGSVSTVVIVGHAAVLLGFAVSSAGWPVRVEEHLVEARLAERQLRHADAGRASCASAAAACAGSEVRAASAAGSAASWTHRRRLAPGRRRAVEPTRPWPSTSSDQPGLRPLLGVVEADVQRARADQVFRSLLVPSAMTRPWSTMAMRSAS